MLTQKRYTPGEIQKAGCLILEQASKTGTSRTAIPGGWLEAADLDDRFQFLQCMRQSEEDGSANAGRGKEWNEQDAADFVED
jgi:hypothetical protein